jgi:cytochrome oxidase assembly protein ShyY1
MTTTSWIALAVMAVLVVFYMMRRKSRLSRED